jgi:hypothetical protein
MPRRSASELAIVPIDSKRSRPRLAPSAGAPADVVEIFAEILASAPATHFKTGDAPLIEAYAAAVSLARQSAQEMSANGPVIGGRPSPWVHCQEKAMRAIAALAMRLRLSPQHRADSRSAMRKADGPTGPRTTSCARSTAMTSSVTDDINELDDMIAALAQEHGVPYPIFPQHAREGAPVPRGYEEIRHQALEWRVKLVAELEQRSDWVSEWRAERALDASIERLCEEGGLHFKPHETPPWWAPDELPDDYAPDGTGGNDSLPQAVKLRRKLIAEIEAQGEGR